MIHPIYLPFEREELLPHFTNAKHIDAFVESAARHQAFSSRFHGNLSGMSLSAEVRKHRQMEKDECFWTACTLKTVFDNAAFSGVFKAAFGPTPPLRGFSSWDECVGQKSDQRLLFEVAAPSPHDYRSALRRRFDEDGNSAHMVPYVVDAAKGNAGLEGPTKVDAFFVNTANGFGVMFEAKVLSDISCQVTFDPFRNQFARNIDVMLDDATIERLPRKSASTLFCLLTPKIFKEQPTTRYYGVLFDHYKQNPHLLTEYLPHRANVDFAAIAQRLGWLTFEDCMTVCPDACPWLRGDDES
jgi:hypothetical protein